MGDDDLCRGVGERRRGGVGAFCTTGDGTGCEGGSGGGRWNGGVILRGELLVSKFAMGIAGPVPTP